MQHHEFKESFNQVIGRFEFLISQYKKDTIIDDCPERYRYENFGIKRYLCDGKQQHDTHVDADDAKRFVAFVCYLNDDFDEGETIFPHHNYQSTVSTGSVLVSCCMELSSQGKPLTNGNSKYILNSFLQYEQRLTMNRMGDKTMGLDNSNI